MLQYAAVKAIQNAIRNSKDIEAKARRENSFEGSEVTAELSSADHFALAINMLFVNSKTMIVLLVIFCLFGLIFLASNLIEFALAFFGIALFCLLYLFFIAYMKSVAHGNTSKIGYGFAQTGLFVKSEYGYLCLPWKNTRARETGKQYFFYYSTFGALILPKRCVSPEQKAMIDDYISTFDLKKRPSGRRS